MRIRYFELSPDAFSGFLRTQEAIEQGPLERTLIQLVYQRVSLINGCSFCLTRRAKQLRDAGETDERIDALAGWRACGLYTPRERTALAWADAVTKIDQSAGLRGDFEALKTYFDSREIADLTMATALMTAINRVAISLQHYGNGDCRQ